MISAVPRKKSGKRCSSFGRYGGRSDHDSVGSSSVGEVLLEHLLDHDASRQPCTVASWVPALSAVERFFCGLKRGTPRQSLLQAGQLLQRGRRALSLSLYWWSLSTESLDFYRQSHDSEGMPLESYVLNYPASLIVTASPFSD